MLKVSQWGLLSSFALYLVVGFFGYATVGSKVSSNFLKGFQVKELGEPLYIILNVTFVISSTCSFPVIFYGGRNNLLFIIKEFRSWLHTK